MSSSASLRNLLLLSVLASLAACTTIEGPTTVPSETTSSQETGTTTENIESPVTEVVVDEATTAVEQPVAPPPPSTNPAVVALLDNAHNELDAGRFPTATSAIERALRIEPRNPQLWHELAKVKLQKGEYQQAENFAARSNAWAGNNKALLARNWRLIAEARSLRGDTRGAKAAQARATSLEADSRQTPSE